jgi:hypothetical protein
MNILHLLLAGGIKPDDPLPRGGVFRLLKVRAQPRQQRASPLRNAVAGVGGAGAVGRVGALVEVLEGGDEAGRDVVLLVEGNGFLQALVGDQVAVREDLGEDARARLFLLA